MARACDSCYTRKIKCDAAVPKCNRCSHHGLACTFHRVVKRRQKAKDHESGPTASRLSERISRIEQRVTEHLIWNPGFVPVGFSQSTEIGPSASSSPRVSSNKTLASSRTELGESSLLTGAPYLLSGCQQWIQAPIWLATSSHNGWPVRPCLEKEQGQGPNALLMNPRSHDPFELPNRRVVHLYFDVYKNSVMQRIFPVINDDLFEDTIISAYSKTQTSSRLGQASSVACVMAFVALTASSPLINIDTGMIRLFPVDEDALASKSQILLIQTWQEPAGLDGLQAATMLTIYELSSGNLRSANYFLSIAARQLFMLGANLAINQVSPEGGESRTKQQQVRNLFWICYTLDKDLALRLGQPPTIADENCDLTLPPGYLNEAFSDLEKEYSSNKGPLFPFDLRLSILKSRAYSELYSVSALGKSNADYLKSIREFVGT